MDNARLKAYTILNRIEKDGAYSNLLLKEYFKSEQDAREAAFVRALVSGTLERLYTLDYFLSLCLREPLKKLKPQVLSVLRLGAYQILFMEKVPVSAAVNESVNLAKRAGCGFASGLVNACLRGVARNGLAWPEKGENASEYYKIRYSYPQELADLLSDTYGGENAVGIMENSLGRQPLYGRVNTLKCDAEELRGVMGESFIPIEGGFPEGAFELGAAEFAVPLEKIAEKLMSF